MKSTPEQQAIIDYVKGGVCDKVVLVNSVAGSGKTTLLVSIANTITHSNGLYLAYTKTIAVESQPKFPSTTKCVTTHSLAYRHTVKPFKYSISSLTYRDIKDNIPYVSKCLLVDSIREFCLSKYESFDDFSEAEDLDSSTTKLANTYLTKMEEGVIPCTHDFYLKVFHLLLLHKQVEFDTFDFIMLDEAGDLNEVTLEIFKLLPAKLKIAVGDDAQNIYSFNHTVNCFELLEEDGVLFKMTQSFRVNKDIAKRIEKFCRNTINPGMDFKGVDTKGSVVTRAMISRTNGALIDSMISLNEDGTPYNLVRRASDIFQLPLTLAGLKKGGKPYDSAFNYLQIDFNTWSNSAKLKSKWKSPFVYIASEHPNDVQLKAAVRLLVTRGKSLLFETYRLAKLHEEEKHNLVLMTAHSSKGLELDEVILSDDMNSMLEKVVTKVVQGEINTDDREYLDAVYLYYVACSRAKKSLINATGLELTQRLI